MTEQIYTFRLIGATWIKPAGPNLIAAWHRGDTLRIVTETGGAERARLRPYHPMIKFDGRQAYISASADYPLRVIVEAGPAVSVFLWSGRGWAQDRVTRGPDVTPAPHAGSGVGTDGAGLDVAPAWPGPAPSVDDVIAGLRKIDALRVEAADLLYGSFEPVPPTRKAEQAAQRLTVAGAEAQRLIDRLLAHGINRP